MNHIAIDIVQEVSKIVLEDNSFESQGLRNAAKFCKFLRKRYSKIIYYNKITLWQFFEWIKNAIVEMIGFFIINFLYK